MATVIPSSPSSGFSLPPSWSMADLQDHLGGIPAERIRVSPPPGSATEKDVDEIATHEGRLFELIDGILVEKAMGTFESLVAGVILTEISIYLRSNDLGLAFPGDGPFRILPKVVKIPDVSFVSWQRLPTGMTSRPGIAAVTPDLAVEVLSESNTRREMSNKLARYFTAGVRLVWHIDPVDRTAEVFTGIEERTHIDANGTLDGGDVLPGLRLSLAYLFALAERQPPAS
jgi:Uma2 family endonuclease